MRYRILGLRSDQEQLLYDAYRKDRQETVRSRTSQCLSQFYTATCKQAHVCQFCPETAGLGDQIRHLTENQPLFRSNSAIDRNRGLVLYETSRASCGSKNLATSRIASFIKIRRTIASIGDRRQCHSGSYCPLVDLAIISFFAGSREKKKK